jgi:hypothetical protein
MPTTKSFDVEMRGGDAKEREGGLSRAGLSAQLSFYPQLSG